VPAPIGHCSTHAPLGQCERRFAWRHSALGGGGHGNVRALRHQLGSQALDVVLVDDVGKRRQDPNLTLDVGDSFGTELLPTVVLDDAADSLF